MEEIQTQKRTKKKEKYRTLSLVAFSECAVMRPFVERFFTARQFTERRFHRMCRFSDWTFPRTLFQRVHFSSLRTFSAITRQKHLNMFFFYRRVFKPKPLRVSSPIILFSIKETTCPVSADAMALWKFINCLNAELRKAQNNAMSNCLQGRKNMKGATDGYVGQSTHLKIGPQLNFSVVLPTI